MTPPLCSPYAYLQLWRNPFGELRPSERAELAVVDVAPLLSFLAEPRHVVQFVGACGFGKSTHLLALARHFPTAALVYFPETGPRPQLPPLRPLFVDEAQRMGWRRRRQLLRGPGPLAIGTHQDLTKPLQRAGFVVLSVDVQQPKSAASVADILNRRIAASRLGTPAELAAAMAPAINEDFAAQLIDRFGSNLRAIENYLYDDLQHSVKEKRQWPLAS